MSEKRVPICTNQSLAQSSCFLISCNKNAILKRGGEPKSRRQWAIHATAILWESNIAMEHHQITLLIGKSFIYHHYQSQVKLSEVHILLFQGRKSTEGANEVPTSSILWMFYC
jgi:hypothetical protein